MVTLASTWAAVERIDKVPSESTLRIIPQTSATLEEFSALYLLIDATIEDNKRDTGNFPATIQTVQIGKYNFAIDIDLNWRKLQEIYRLLNVLLKPQYTSSGDARVISYFTAEGGYTHSQIKFNADVEFPGSVAALAENVEQVLNAELSEEKNVLTVSLSIDTDADQALGVAYAVATAIKMRLPDGSVTKTEDRD